MTQWHELFTEAVRYATKAHCGQVRKGPLALPYIIHPMSVVDEVSRYSELIGDELWQGMIGAAIHDTLEDTDATEEELRGIFGDEISDGVVALSKDKTIEGKEIQFLDMLNRVGDSARWVRVVKMGDRYCNLKEFPAFWSNEKIAQYLSEGEKIARHFNEASPEMATMLMAKVYEHRNTLSITTAAR